MKIQALIEKYFEGETSLEEEAQLRNYFSQGEVAAELQVYEPLFSHLASVQEQSLPDDFDEQLMEKLEAEGEAKIVRLRPNWSRQLMRVAAVGVVLLTALFFLNRPQQLRGQQASIDWSKYEITDEQMAYEETVKALKLLSTKLNKGSKKATHEVEKMEKVGKYLN